MSKPADPLDGTAARLDRVPEASPLRRVWQSATGYGVCLLGRSMAWQRGPTFALANAPPAPDYRLPQAWLARPEQLGLAGSAPRGETAIDPAHARADVFFIHPTTFVGSPVCNAPYDASEHEAPLNAPVLVQQASVFNACCRIYAPHYRQATLAALRNPLAVELAYSDLARAFQHYIATENQGRPFIVASHSQGTTHAVRLLQAEVLGTPLQSRLIAAYLIGGYVPESFGELGLPISEQPDQTGCVIAYNTCQVGTAGTRLIADSPAYWWRGAYLERGPAKAICINPLTWTRAPSAPARANAGSLAFAQTPLGTTAQSLDLHPHLTGATVYQHLLEVDIPVNAPAGFHDKLSGWTGSYHLNDYGLFYASLRRNAQVRVAAWWAQSA